MSENSDGENGLPRGPVPVELSVSYCVGTSKAYDENVRESTFHCSNDRMITAMLSALGITADSD